jgi:hypothetical protein
MRIVLLPLFLLATVFSATTGAATARSQGAAIAHPKAARAVVVRVTSGGGFVTPQTNLRALPSFTLYGDGTIIVPGAVIQIYPGPAVYPLVRSKLDERGVQALLKRAQQSGLLAPRTIDYGGMGAVGVSDMPTTTLFVNAAGRRVKRAAYALGASGQGGRLTAAQTQARHALAQFIAKLPHGLAGRAAPPHALAIYVAPYAGQAQPGSARIVWPLERSLATAGKPVSSGLGYRCIAVGGKDAKTLLATLGKANEQSRWTAGPGAKATYQLVARPLLPDERGCPSTGG